MTLKYFNFLNNFLKEKYIQLLYENKLLSCIYAENIMGKIPFIIANKKIKYLGLNK